jgi:hypothetical protein
LRDVRIATRWRWGSRKGKAHARSRIGRTDAHRRSDGFCSFNTFAVDALNVGAEVGERFAICRIGRPDALGTESVHGGNSSIRRRNDGIRRRRRVQAHNWR